MRSLTAVILVLPVAVCLALSKNEIEEFTEYLWKTSVLDQNLKDGTNVDQDEEEEVSDNAWEESGKFEGDLILNERQRRLIAEDVAEGLARNGLRDSTKRWPNNEVIFYIQREHFSGDQVQAIKEGIDDLSQASCIKFRPYKKGDRDAVVIQGSRRGCFSQVGYQGGYQVLNLSGRHPVGRGCFRHGTVVHELLHTLGFYHMQSSHDRDEFIDVVWANIVQPARHNFRKYNAFSVSDFGVGYDYDSVLHYSRRAFSSNGGDTLVPKQSGAQIGQRVGLSDKDTQKLNKMYCDADPNNSDDAAVEPAKPKNKKKTKNQPFQGHGIGYHQGKTVVIKLPVAETYKLPDSPSYAVFDYFSKAPQALPPTLVQGLGVGKEISYYRPPASSFDTGKDKQVGHKEPAKSLKEKPFIEKDIKTQLHAAVDFFPSSDGSKNVEEHPSKDMPKDSVKKPVVDSKVHKDLLQALERLDKLIKTHIYPSSKSDATKVHDNNKEYSKFYKPSTNEHAFNAKPTEELHSPKISDLIEATKKDAVDTNYEKLNDTSNDNSTFFVSPLYSKIYGEVDSTFGTFMPIKKSIGQKFTTQYSTPSSEDDEFAYVNSYNDYMRLYKPKSKSFVSESREPYTLLGDPVPLQDHWYRDAYEKPVYDSPQKKHGANAIGRLQVESESVKDKTVNNRDNFEDKESISVPYERKFSSEEDSSSIEGLYEENAGEKMFDKYGHLGNSKTRRSDDSTEHYSRYRYPKPMSAQINEGDKRAELSKPVSQRGYYWDRIREADQTSGHLKVKNRNSHENKTSQVPVNYKNKKEAFTIAKQKKLSNNEINNSIPTKNITHAVSYRVTEEPEENDIENIYESDSDYSSFERSMDDRLKTIIKNYEKINNFDIELPYDRYDSHNESSGSSEMVVRLDDSHKIIKTESGKKN